MQFVIERLRSRSPPRQRWRASQHYDIHFPPDAPTGFIDHFVGPPDPKALLDERCVYVAG